MKKNKHMRSITMLTGSLLAVMIVCIQFFHFSHNISKSEVKTEQQESSPSADIPLVSMASYSIPSPVHVTINLDAYCLFEILFEQSTESDASAEAPLYPEKLFITLFRVIISPNAP
jgi:hypothetical protein